ncbi:MAG: tRNA 2-thiouridine(34) synthase MnmA [Clostridiales Family XIII bacterium]|jgi:tRNA-specific 2-thiouridylase|nr:tRNA 2-thiouridine(34) synthase MnmA [Clostridiales Family XIII bacterium]
MATTKPKAMVAMSGGVDSSVAALLAQRAGYDCVGVTMKLFANEDVGEDAGRPCCSLADAGDAARAAVALGIPHYVFDFTEEFRRDVIGRFAAAYAGGATPNPCIDCNDYLKFGRLLARARQMGFDKLVTGHYARIIPVDDGARWGLARAAYREKDQTYFLYTMTQDQLAHTLFPLADLTKPEVRALAAEAGLPTAAKRESQDICFVRDGDYQAFLEQYFGTGTGGSDTFGGTGNQNGLSPGNFVDADGCVLGRHGGIARYTIGQRKGLGVALGRPAYVAEIRPDTNEVVLVTDESAVFCDTIQVEDVNWIAFAAPPREPLRAQVQIRYAAPPVPATITAQARDGTVTVTFGAPVRAPARGQAAVFYDGDVCLGGGRIV